jgi:hypothetical protein
VEDECEQLRMKNSRRGAQSPAFYLLDLDHIFNSEDQRRVLWLWTKRRKK